MNTPLYRGDIYFCDLDPAFGCEQGGTRPVLVIQNNTGNAHSATTIVAAITHKDKPALPTHVALQGVSGLKDGSVVLLEQIRTIDRGRLSRRVGMLSEQHMEHVGAALKISLGLCPHHKEFMLITLCQTCAQSFEDSNEYRVIRATPDQSIKETCTICNIRTGFDYQVSKTAHRDI